MRTDKDPQPKYWDLPSGSKVLDDRVEKAHRIKASDGGDSYLPGNGAILSSIRAPRRTAGRTHDRETEEERRLVRLDECTS